MPLKLPHKKKKDNAPQQEAEATEQQSVKRGTGKKKDHTEAKHRLRNTAFALIVVVLLGVIGCMIASQFFPEISQFRCRNHTSGDCRSAAWGPLLWLLFDCSLSHVFVKINKKIA